MPISFGFKDNALQRLCEQEKLAVRQLGSNSARKLRTRLADLAAATSVGALVAGKPHPLFGDRHGQFAVWLDGGCRLVFEPAMDPIPRREDGSIDWMKVTQVAIVFIGNYHG